MINGICRRLCFNDNDDEIFRGTCSASSKAAAEYCDHQNVGLSVANISPKSHVRTLPNFLRMLLVAVARSPRAAYFRFCGLCHIFYNGPPYEGTWIPLRRRLCVVVRSLTPLLLGVGCVQSWTIASPKTRRVLRTRAAGGGVCN